MANINYWCECGRVATWFARRNASSPTNKLMWATCDEHLARDLRKLTRRGNQVHYSATVREEKQQ